MVHDITKLKEVAGSFPTGVTVVTIKKPSGDIHGMTASSFLSLSLNPPMILFAVKKENEITSYLKTGKKIGVSILSEDMLDESNHFANIRLMKEPPVFCDEDEVKILKGSVAWYSVEVIRIYNEGDHIIVICSIKNLDIKSKKKPTIILQRIFQNKTLVQFFLKINFSLRKNINFMFHFCECCLTLHSCNVSLRPMKSFPCMEGFFC